MQAAQNNEIQPEWFSIGNELLWPLIGMGVATARAHHLPTLDLQVLPELALCHHAGCIEASSHINRRGKHSAAICLVRQSVEALTITEIGLQGAEFAEPLLAGWKEGKKSHGELRKALEKNVWPTYGTGYGMRVGRSSTAILRVLSSHMLTTRRSYRDGSSLL
jgi:hypothetical protein